MNFYSIRDLRSETKNICEKVRQSGEVVITNNGKPSVLMLDISEDSFDEVVRAIRQAKAMIAFNSMKAVAAANGYMPDSDSTNGKYDHVFFIVALLNVHVKASLNLLHHCGDFIFRPLPFFAGIFAGWFPPLFVRRA